jgi:hypothetical protein
MSIKIIELASYTAPKITENKRDEWVSYGDDNNYYQHLIDLYNASPTNNAAINGISQMIFGRGLDATDSSQKLEEYAMLKSLFHDDCVRKLSYDLKLMGQCAMQVVYDKPHKKIIEVAHFPIETLRTGKANEEGVIDAYYYFNDWASKKPSDKPIRFSAFGTSKDEIEILCVKPYRAGFYYYSPVDYQGGLQYAELEEEVSNYHLNNIKNGLAPSMLINFSNGVPDEETQEIIENKIKQKFSGTSNAGKFILSFSDNVESQASIETVQLSDAHNQYQFLSDESMRKIMVAHRIISPMLLGIKDNTGLGNNADELKTASILFDNTVIRPFQELLLTAFDKVLSFNNAALNLYFKTLQPLEFVDLENALTKEQVEEETGQKLSSDLKDLTDEEFEALEQDLEGEVIDDEWELVDKREYSEENESVEAWANRLIKEKKTGLQKLADFIKSKPSEPSSLDKSYYKVRYEYAEKYSSNNSRKFCRNMMSRTGRGVVYRKEDIDQASFQGVNNSFGHKGQNYSLFKYKGGVNCGHFWNENLYRLKKKTDGSFYEDKSLASSEEVDNIPKSYVPKGGEYETAKVAPKDMPNNGHHPNYKG